VKKEVGGGKSKTARLRVLTDAHNGNSFVFSIGGCYFGQGEAKGGGKKATGVLSDLSNQKPSLRLRGMPCLFKRIRKIVRERRDETI